MQVEEYCEHDLTGLAALLGDGQVNSAEVHDAARAAIEEVNTHCNAVADGPWDEPLAFDARGPLAGVPFAVKDLLCHPRDVPMRLGTRLAGNGLTLGHDTYLMERFRRAGLATAALTTTPELGVSMSTEALIYGPTRNPWDLTKSPGGSSGGSAALVAAGAVPAAHANDSAGSIRAPAALCGLVGLKPSRGRVPIGPDAQEIVFGQLTEFAVTRTVRDTAALLDLVAGPAPGEKAPLPRPPRPFRDEIEIDPGTLRVAVHTGAWSGGVVDAEVRATVEQVAERLEDLGHHVESATPEIDWDTFAECQITIWSVAMAEAITGIAMASGLEPGEDTLEAVTLATLRRGLGVSALELSTALSAVNTISRSVGGFLADVDVLLTPTCNTPAWPVGEIDQNRPGLDTRGWLQQIFDHRATFTPVFNVTGTPAISLPLGMSGQGLPIGVQLAADMGAEATLLRLAAQLEGAMPWAGRSPSVYAGSTTRPAIRAASNSGEQRSLTGS